MLQSDMACKSTAVLRIDEKSRRERVLYVLFICGVWIYLFLFFSKIHPLMMHDGDDWAYASYSRGALPIWGYWNPAKVFPETFMPACVSFAAYFVMPLGFDLSWAIAYAVAAVVSTVITAYIALMERYLHRQYGGPRAFCVLLTMLFFVCHFLVFRTQRDHNTHMFYSWNVNGYFNYLMPALLNAGIVIIMESGNVFRRFGDKEHLVTQSIAFLIGYLAVFSNLYSNYIPFHLCPCIYRTHLFEY